MAQQTNTLQVKTMSQLWSILIRFTLLLNLSFPMCCSCDIELLEMIRHHPDKHWNKPWSQEMGIVFFDVIIVAGVVGVYR